MVLLINVIPVNGTEFDQCGIGSWYGNHFHGRKTASGDVFNQNGLTAAHRSLAFGTKVSIINQTNGKEVVVTINDRGPFHKNRIVDVSKQAAQDLGFKNKGTDKLCLKVIDMQ
jgi:rare lipoprotein A